MQAIGALKEFADAVREIFNSCTPSGDAAPKKALVEALDSKLSKLLSIGERAGDAAGQKFVRALEAIDADGSSFITLGTFIAIFESEGLVAPSSISDAQLATRAVGDSFHVAFAADTQEGSRRRMPSSRTGLRVPGARPLRAEIPPTVVDPGRVEEYIRRLQGDLADLCMKAIALLPRHERLSMHKTELVKKMSKKVLDREYSKFNRSASGCMSSDDFCSLLNTFAPPDQEGQWNDAIYSLCNQFGGDFKSFSHALFLLDGPPETTTSRFGFASQGAATRAAALLPPPNEQRPEVGRGPFDRKGCGERVVKNVRRNRLPRRIKYPHCKTTVQPPSSFDLSLVQRSARLPDPDLQLVFMYGYQGSHLSQNLFFSANSSLCYYLAAAGVAFNHRSHTQQFFLNHTDDISCLCIDPTRELIATGQIGKNPFACVWSARTCEQLGEIGAVAAPAVVIQPQAMETKGSLFATTGQPLVPTLVVVQVSSSASKEHDCFYERAICALAFSADSRWLVAIGQDNKHRIGLWDWQGGTLLAEGTARTGTPPQIHDICWRPPGSRKRGAGSTKANAMAADFVSHGEAHITFWTYNPPKEMGTQGTLRRRGGKYGAIGAPRKVCAAVFTRGGSVISCGDNGKVYLWDGAGSCVFAFAAHRGACYTLAMTPGALVSGGKDGHVRWWMLAADGEVAKDCTGRAARCMCEVNIQTALHSEGDGGELDDTRQPTASFAERDNRNRRKVLPGGGTGRVRQGAGKSVRMLGRPPEQHETQLHDWEGNKDGGGSGSKPMSPKVAWAAAKSKSRRSASDAGGGTAEELHTVRTLDWWNGMLAVGTNRACIFVAEDEGRGSGGRGAAASFAGGPPTATATLSASSDLRLVMRGHFGDVNALGVVHNNRQSIFVTAGLEGRVCLWDAESRQLLRTARLPSNSPARCVAVCDVGGWVAVGGEDGLLTILRASDFTTVVRRRVCKLKGAAISCVRFSPDGQLLAIGTHERVVDVLGVRDQFRRIHRCVGHSATIAHLDWSQDSRVVQSNCTGGEIIYWDAARRGTGLALRSTSDDVEANTEWATWTCTLGFPVMGIWPAETSGSDINACDMSVNGQLLVTADDFGLVKLFNAPCIVHLAPFKSYCGHSSHVADVRFLGSQHLISVGGHDLAVFQFRLVSKEEQEEEDDFESDGY